MVSKESLLFWNMVNNKDGVINTVHTPVARGTKILSGADGHLLSSTDEKYFSRNPQTGTSTTFMEWKKAGKCTCISFWICVFQILGMKKAVLCEVAGLFTNPCSWDRQELDHRETLTRASRILDAERHQHFTGKENSMKDLSEINLSSGQSYWKWKWSDIVNPQQVGNLCFWLKASLPIAPMCWIIWAANGFRHYSWSMSLVLCRALSFTQVRVCYFSLLIQGWTVLWTEPNNQMLQPSHFSQELREEPWTFDTKLRNLAKPQWSLDPYAWPICSTFASEENACMHASKQRTTTVAWHLPPSNPLPRKSFAKGLEDEIQILEKEDRIQIRTQENKKFHMWVDAEINVYLRL